MSSDPVIDEIKSKLDIVEVVGRYVTLKKSGANWKAPCPFHGEKTPSFMVNRERQNYRCYGCGESGDIISFVMKQENIDFPQALEILAGQAGVTLPERSTNAGGPSKKTLIDVNNLAAKFFHYILKNHPTGEMARNYLKSRGVSTASIDTFMIGYAPVDSSALRGLYAKHSIKPDLVKLAGSPDRFRHRIMFPFRDIIGSVIGFSGRALGDEQPKYLNTGETNLFHKNRYLYGLFEAKKAIGKKNSIVMVEGQLDVVLSHQAGCDITIATSGTAFGEEHLKIIERYAPQALLAFDGDAAGQKALDRAIRFAAVGDYAVQVVPVPESHDPGDLAQKSPDDWLKLVANPIEPIDWLLTYYFPEGAKATLKTERETVYAAVFPYIKLIPDAISQAAALQRLARLLGVTDDQTLKDVFESWKPAGAPRGREVVAQNPPAPNLKTNPLSPAKKQEQHILGVILLHPELLAYPELELTPEDFTSDTYANLYTTIKSCYTKGTIQSSDLIQSAQATLPPEGVQPFQSFIFDTQTELGEATAEHILTDYTMTIERLRVKRKEGRMQSYAGLIAQAEASGDRAEVVRLMQEMQNSLIPNKKDQNAQKNPSSG